VWRVSGSGQRQRLAEDSGAGGAETRKPAGDPNQREEEAEMANVYVPFYSRYGNVETMAKAVAEGVAEQGSVAKLAFTGDVMTPQQVMDADANWKATHERLMAQYPLVSTAEVAAADGVAFGAPTRFGVMAAQMKNFFDSMGGLWVSGATVGKPAGSFTSTATIHGGQEVSNYTMYPVLVHLGFIIVGVPYSVPELTRTTTGGGPYGPSHVAGARGEVPCDPTELTICRAFGRRLAEIAEILAKAKG
jgi:NAD(P)H dehydrogenase (quinone)